MRMDPVAIIGIGSIFPGSTAVAGFWRDVVAGRDLMSDVPAGYWLVEDYYDPDPHAPDKTYCKRGAFLSEIDFDYMKYGIPPSNLSSTDTSQLLGLMVAEAALMDATQGRFPEVDRERISVIIGHTGATELFADMAARTRAPRWEEALRRRGLPELELKQISAEISKLTVPWTEASFPGLLGNVVAGRIANRLDLHGTNCVVDAACASSLAALNMGIAELSLGAADMVLVGGIDTMNDPMMYLCFSKTPALSGSGDCRPFSADADGTMLGEGLAMFVLQRLEDAEREGNRVYAVIRGIGSSSDGKSKSVYAPVHEGQARALRRAYASAGYAPDTVELVEAHGTATRAGDTTEFAGLKEVFEEANPVKKQWCALGSVKSQIGHTKCTAGMAGLLKAVLALHHKTLPPTLKVSKPNEALDVDQSPFYLNTELRPWIRGPQHPRRASVSSFGFGGSNFHVALEEYSEAPGRPARFRHAPAELLVWSAANPQSLEKSMTRVLASLSDGNGAASLESLAVESQRGFDVALPSRLAIVANDCDDLRGKIGRALRSLAAAPDDAVATTDGIYYENAAESGGIAFVFAGQGSQYANMGSDLAIMFDRATQVWDRLADIDFAPLPLHAVVFPRPAFSDAEREANDRLLKEPQWSQPAIAACALSHLAILEQLGIAPDAVAGHSFGELVALHAAGVFDQGALLRLARKRGELMLHGAGGEETSMTAVFAPPEVAAGIVASADGVVVANYNSPTQTVISGRTRSLEAIESELRGRKIHFSRLPVDAAFHSPAMRQPAAAFGEYLRGLDFHAPRKTVFAGSTGIPYGQDTEAFPAALAGQLHQPVRFVETIRAMYSAGCRTFIEVGPGSVLTGLAREILAGDSACCIAMDRRGEHSVTKLWQALAQMTVRGVPVRFEAIWEGFRECAAERSSDAEGRHLVKISGANYGRPYPPRSKQTSGAQSALGGGIVSDAGDTRAIDMPLPESFAPNGTGAGAAAVPAHVRKGEPVLPASFEPPDEGPDFGRGPAIPESDTNRIPEAGSQKVMETAPMIHRLPAENAGGTNAARFGLSVDSGWVRTLQELDRSTAAAEKAFQEALKSSYDAYLEAMQSAHSALERALQPGTSQEVPPTRPTREASVYGNVDRPETPDALSEPVPEPPDDFSPPLSAAGLSGQTATPADPPADKDFEGTLLGIVSEKTGYPEDLLDLDAELEAGLGIDSIKRVEILSALQTQVPDSANRFDPAELLKLTTLRDVLGVLCERLDEEPGDGEPRRNESERAPETCGFEGTLLGIVSEKTGYPEDLLDLDAELEAGLGIDSIKRVEILSALQAQVPDGANRLDPAELLKLTTLRDVLKSLGEGNAAVAQATASLTPPSPRVSTRVLPSRAGSVLFRGEVEAVRAPATGLTMAGLFASSPVTIVVREPRTEDFTGETAHLLAEILNQKGLNARVSDEPGSDAHGVILLDGLRRPANLEEGLEINEAAFASAAQFSDCAQTHGGVFVTIQDTGGSFGLSGKPASEPCVGGLAALAKVAALEWPRVCSKAIDIDVGGRSPSAVAPAIAAELLCGGPESEVGLDRLGCRRTLRVRSGSLPRPGAWPIDRDGVMIVSGGARGVTAEALVALAAEHPLRLVLLGRTALEAEPPCCAGFQGEPGLTTALMQQARAEGRELPLIDAKIQAQGIIARREIQTNLSRLRALGAEVRYVPVDILDQSALHAVIDDVHRTWGPIRAVVHGAGIVHDKLIRDKTLEQFRRVMRTKVVGLDHLLAATRQDPLSVICIFSSIAARSGNPGQCDYAMANEIMNKVAGAEQERRGDTCVVKSINWGPWEAGMVSPELRVRFEEAGIPVISLLEGARTFVKEITTGSGDSAEVIVLGSFPDGSLPDVRRAVPGGDRVYEAELELTPERFPFLDDHRVQGCPVLPVVIVLEFFTRMAHAVLPGLTLHRIRDLKVLAGVRLTDFRGGCRLRINCRTVSSSGGFESLALELAGEERRHFSAIADLASSQSAPGRIEAFPRAANTDAGTQPDPYRDILFHGPSFRVIQLVETVEAERARARLSGTADGAWPGGPWLTEPAALDGGLQLARVWANDRCGFKSLPMAIGEFSTCPSGKPVAACELRAGDVSPMEARVDLSFFDAENGLVAEMRDVLMMMEPQMTPAATS